MEKEGADNIVSNEIDEADDEYSVLEAALVTTTERDGQPTNLFEYIFKMFSSQ